jgi:hypothetical protein
VVALLRTFRVQTAYMWYSPDCEYFRGTHMSTNRGRLDTRVESRTSYAKGEFKQEYKIQGRQTQKSICIGKPFRRVLNGAAIRAGVAQVPSPSNVVLCNPLAWILNSSTITQTLHKESKVLVGYKGRHLERYQPTCDWSKEAILHAVVSPPTQSILCPARQCCN